MIMSAKILSDDLGKWNLEVLQNFHHDHMVLSLRIQGGFCIRNGLIYVTPPIEKKNTVIT